MRDEPHGKVVRIEDEHSLWVDLGTKTSPSVSKGDSLIVYTLGEEIVDPDTGEPLGRVQWVKAEVEVVQAQDILCRAETPGVNRLVTGHEVTLGARALLGIWGGKVETVTEHPSFLVDQDSCEPLDKVDLTVRKGDLVRLAKRASQS